MRHVLLADRAICPACHRRIYTAHVRTDNWLKCPDCKGWYFIMLIPPHMAAGYLAGFLTDQDAFALLCLLWPHHRQMPVMELFGQSLTMGSSNPKFLAVSATGPEADAQKLDTARDIIHALLKAS